MKHNSSLKWPLLGISGYSGTDLHECACGQHVSNQHAMQTCNPRTRLRQEDGDFEASLRYIARPHLKILMFVRWITKLQIYGTL